MNKKSQQVFGISFGVIFSIILIVFIVTIGIIVARAFLNFGDCGELKLFVDKFEDEIRRAYKSEELGFDFESGVGGGVEYVCFLNSSSGIRGQWEERGYEINVYDDENLIFYPLDVCAPAHNIAYLDIGEITRFDNPYCVKVNKGKVKLRIKKEMNHRFVEVRG